MVWIWLWSGGDGLVLLGPSTQIWAGCRNSCWAQVNSLSLAGFRAIKVSECGGNARAFLMQIHYQAHGGLPVEVSPAQGCCPLRGSVSLACDLEWSWDEVALVEESEYAKGREKGQEGI